MDVIVKEFAPDTVLVFELQRERRIQEAIAMERLVIVVSSTLISWSLGSRIGTDEVLHNAS